MRTAPIAALLTLLCTAASAQTVHLGTVERWFLLLAPMHEAQACIPEGDPLRPALEAVLRDTHAQAMRALTSEFERGMLAGRLMTSAAAAPGEAEDEACLPVLAGLARGLLRLHLR